MAQLASGSQAATSSQMASGSQNEKIARVPEWLYYFSDEQFVVWCKQHKLQVCDQVRPFPEEERAAIFRYATRQRLVN